MLLKLSPVSSRTASRPVAFCQRRTARSTYNGSSSTLPQMRPVSCAAIKTDPEPAKVSKTTSPRFVTSRSASAIIDTGLVVGCIPSNSSRPLPKDDMPG